jgi:phage terminase large subunit
MVMIPRALAAIFQCAVFSGRPTHWLKQRCDAGRAKLLESRHEDNPLLWDRQKNDWTEAGQIYISKLDALTGPRKQRLRYGRWVQAEGVVYEGWDASVHIIDRIPIPPQWPRFWSVDFGFTHPFVWQAWAMDDDGRLYRYREIYMTSRLVEDHARRIVELSKDDRSPKAIICDTDAEDRATLEKHLKRQTTGAPKEVSPGLQEVAARLRKAGDGKPRIFFLRDSLDERDPVLMESKKPCCTEEEFDGYVWDTSGNRKRGEEPLKVNDHGMDAMRYLVYWFEKLRSGNVPAEPFVIGERYYMGERIAGPKPRSPQPPSGPINLIGGTWPW